MNFIPYHQLINDTKRFAQSLPNKYRGIISIPRSGNIPANILALHFNIPVYTIHEFIHGVTFDNYTLRYKKESTSATYLVIDDSCNSGTRMNQCRAELSKFSDYTFEYASIYVSPGSSKYVDKYVLQVPLPRMFEWNIFNHGNLNKTLLDIDGVICPDTSAVSNIDEVLDETRYIDHISKSLPMNIINVPVKGFVTSRMEKYRSITEEWLKKHGFSYGTLYMCNYSNAIERRKLKRYGKDKAEIYARSDAILMIESSQSQANEIFNITQKPVYCTDINKMFRK